MTNVNTAIETVTANSINEQEFIKKLKELAIPKKSLPKIGKFHIGDVYQNSNKNGKKYCHIAIWKGKGFYLTMNTDKDFDLDEITVESNKVEDLNALASSDYEAVKANLKNSDYNPFAFYGILKDKKLHEKVMYDLSLEILKPMVMDVLSMTTKLDHEILEQLVDHLDSVINPDLCFQLIHLIYQEQLKRLNQSETFIEFMKSSVSDYLISDDKTEKPKLEVKEIKPSLEGQVDVGMMYNKLQEKGFKEIKPSLEGQVDVGMMYNKLQEKGFSETVVEKPIEKIVEVIETKPVKPKQPETRKPKATKQTQV